MSETTDAPDVLSGVDALLKINADDQLRERIFDREKALRDYGVDIAVGNARAFHPGSRYRARRAVLAPVGRLPGCNFLLAWIYRC